jgi:hypothetical protein
VFVCMGMCTWVYMHGCILSKTHIRHPPLWNVGRQGNRQEVSGKQGEEEGH